MTGIYDGLIIKRARRMAKVTQQELAQGIGCSRMTINRVEEGKASYRVAKNAAKFLGLDPGSLLHTKSNATEGMELSTQEREVVGAMRRSGAAGAWAVWAYAGHLVNGGPKETAPAAGELGRIAATENQRQRK